MTFSEILLQERKRRGLSQEDLAGMVNVSRQAVSKWETGDAMPDLPKLLALADALELSLDKLCGREAAHAAPSATEPISPKAPPKKRGPLTLLACMTAALLLCLGMLVLSLSAPSVPASSPSALAKEITISGLKFTGVTNSQVHYRFVPSISSPELSYQIVFVDYRGKTFPIDTRCLSGICSGEAKLDSAYMGYSVSVNVTDGTITQSIPVADSLIFSQGNASWNPINS